MEKNVILFGSIPLATKVLKLLENNNSANLKGVCCVDLQSNKWRHEQELPSAYKYCKENNIPILNHNDLLENTYDIGISVRYHKILSQEIIEKFKQGIINAHGGLLPKYRGTYNNIHAILNKEEVFGASLHYISDGIDNGDIVDTREVKIKDDDTGFDLYQKSEEMCYELFVDNLDSIIKGENNRTPQDTIIEKENIDVNNYKSNELSELKKIDLDNINQSYDIIRAFDSPFHEPAYTILDNKKIYLRTKY